MNERDLICIVCPMGCHISVKTDGSSIVSVTGNTCPRGEAYARKEVTNPERTVTTTVRVANRPQMLSVKTASDIPKNRIMDCIAALKDISVNAPVHIGDVILEDAAGTGVNIVATREMP